MTALTVSRVCGVCLVHWLSVREDAQQTAAGEEDEDTPQLHAPGRARSPHHSNGQKHKDRTQAADQGCQIGPDFPAQSGNPATDWLLRGMNGIWKQFD